MVGTGVVIVDNNNDVELQHRSIFAAYHTVEAELRSAVRTPDLRNCNRLGGHHTDTVTARTGYHEAIRMEGLATT
jgi:hypothetical protein